MSRRYSTEEKALALALYLEHGPAEAGRLTGIPSATIRKWAQRDGVTVTRGLNARAGVEAARLSWAERRAELTIRSGEVAMMILERIDGTRSAKNARLLAAAYGTIVDKAQLLDGAATVRTETRSLTAMVDDALDEIIAAREAGGDEQAER